MMIPLLRHLLTAPLRAAIAVGALCVVNGFAPCVQGQTVGYWRFEEGTANSAASGSASIVDSSGNGDNGTPINGPTYSRNVPVSPIPQTGVDNSLSMLFNGTSQRIFIPDSSALAITQSLTLEAYIDPLSIPAASSSQIVFRGDDRSGYDPYHLSLVDGNLKFTVADASNDQAYVQAPFTNADEWSHVAGTLNNVTGVMDLYVNGTVVATTTTTIRPFANLNANDNPGLGIGNVQSSMYSEYFDGYIDEVRISDQALLPNQFLDSPIPEPSMLAVLSVGLMCMLGRRSCRRNSGGLRTDYATSKFI